jgi:hypothetical protein
MPFVRGHFRQGGWVRPHFRRSPSRTVGLGGVTLALIGLAVVGLLGHAGGIPMPPQTVPSTPPPIIAPVTPPRQYIVQVASAVRREEAKEVAAGLKARGVWNAAVLRSDRYQGLRPGYWVTYIGPFEATRQGQLRAERTRQQHAGALVRLVRRRT